MPVDFGYSQHNGIGYSVADHDGVNACHVIAGGSTVFGIGASGDQNSLPSRMERAYIRCNAVDQLWGSQLQLDARDDFVLTSTPSLTKGQKRCLDVWL